MVGGERCCYVCVHRNSIMAKFTYWVLKCMTCCYWALGEAKILLRFSQTSSCCSDIKSWRSNSRWDHICHFFLFQLHISARQLWKRSGNLFLKGLSQTSMKPNNNGSYSARFMRRDQKCWLGYRPYVLYNAITHRLFL